MNILKNIAASRRESLSRPENRVEYGQLPANPGSISRAVRDLSRKRGSKYPVIAEIKPASPSAGVLIDRPDVERIAKAYEDGGACAVSVLTEPSRFNGSFENLRAVTSSCVLPTLMKDFLVDPYQVEVAAKSGASNVLVIAAICDLEYYTALVESYSMESLVEVHSIEEVQLLSEIEPVLVGVNNRNLETLEIDFELSRVLIPEIRDVLGDGVVVISESGVKSREDIDLLYSYGADGFLVGSCLMESPDIRGKVRELVG
ncbi:MAG: indole-3-glycerol phosphate synthase TrpC [Promethearchaeota archaeon]